MLKSKVQIRIQATTEPESKQGAGSKLGTSVGVQGCLRVDWMLGLKIRARERTPHAGNILAIRIGSEAPAEKIVLRVRRK